MLQRQQKNVFAELEQGYGLCYINGRLIVSRRSFVAEKMQGCKLCEISNSLHCSELTYRQTRVVYSEDGLRRLVEIAHSRRILVGKMLLSIGFHIPTFVDLLTASLGYHHMPKELQGHHTRRLPGGGSFDSLDYSTRSRMPPVLQLEDHLLLKWAIEGFRKAGVFRRNLVFRRYAFRYIACTHLCG